MVSAIVFSSVCTCGTKAYLRSPLYNKVQTRKNPTYVWYIILHTRRSCSVVYHENKNYIYVHTCGTQAYIRSAVAYDIVPREKNCWIHRILWLVPNNYLGLYHSLLWQPQITPNHPCSHNFACQHLTIIYGLPAMPTKTSIDNMTKGKANSKRRTDATPNQAPAKAPRSTAVPSTNPTEPQRANLKNPPPTTTPAATAAGSDASATTTRTINTLPSTSSPMLPSSVNVPALGGSGDNETADGDLTSTTAAATTAAFSEQENAAATHLQMTFTIRNFVTQDFFRKVKFITKKEKLAYYSPLTNPMSYCAIVTRGCHLPQGTDPVTWWETVARRVVNKKVNQLRSDKMTALKKQYFGKWWAWVRFQF
jgi:hypothetical protein